MHSLDEALFASCPTRPVPRYGTHSALVDIGHRLLVAADGLWLELRRPWLHLVWPLLQGVPVAIPYGRLQAEMAFAFSCIDTTLLERFVDESREHYPSEHAAWMVWNEQTLALEYRVLHTTARNTGAIAFHRPALCAHEHLCVDIHSHGQHPAFFSDQDDQDDRGEIKLAVVIGEVTSARPSVALRLCAAGLFIDLEPSCLGVVDAQAP